LLLLLLLLLLADFDPAAVLQAANGNSMASGPAPKLWAITPKPITPT
jgi:hypothetical protein